MRSTTLLAAVVMLLGLVASVGAQDFMKFSFLDGHDRQVEELSGQTTAVFAFCKG